MWYSHTCLHCGIIVIKPLNFTCKLHVIVCDYFTIKFKNHVIHSYNLF